MLSHCAILQLLQFVMDKRLPYNTGHLRRHKNLITGRDIGYLSDLETKNYLSPLIVFLSFICDHEQYKKPKGDYSIAAYLEFLFFSTR